MVHSAKHRALFITLGLFVLVVLLSHRPRPKASESDLASQTWPLKLDLIADISDLLRSQEVVQDTLNYYVAAFANQSAELRTTWNFESCCAGSQFVTKGQAFRSSLKAEFLHQKMRYAVLNALQNSTYLHIREVHVLHGLSYGTLDLNLPIPGTAGEILALKDVAFNLRMSRTFSAYIS
ncbi:MAG TPA: hypothetical protein ENJ82_12980 [Bacteroidetes bacterium]|nr:hypothetical protein [Bacteroidota bacterium]